MGNKTEIYSVYTQIGDVVAKAMSEEGKLKLIPLDLMPQSQLKNENGEQAYCAIAVNMQQLTEFNRRVAALRA